LGSFVAIILLARRRPCAPFSPDSHGAVAALPFALQCPFVRPSLPLHLPVNGFAMANHWFRDGSSVPLRSLVNGFQQLSY